MSPHFFVSINDLCRSPSTFILFLFCSKIINLWYWGYRTGTETASEADQRRTARKPSLTHHAPLPVRLLRGFGGAAPLVTCPNSTFTRLKRTWTRSFASSHPGRHHVPNPCGAEKATCPSGRLRAPHKNTGRSPHRNRAPRPRTLGEGRAYKSRSRCTRETNHHQLLHN